MNTDPVFSVNTAASVASWPSCPKCKGREVLVRGVTLKCLSCLHSGPVSLTSPVLQFVRARHACRPELTPCAIHFGPFPQKVDEEFGDILSQRCSEFFQEQLFAREFLKAYNHYKKNGNFNSVAITVDLHGNQPSVLKLSPPTCDNVEMGQLLLADQVKDMSAVAVIYPSSYHKSDDFMSNEIYAERGDGLFINVHSYGSPSIAAFLKSSPIDLDWRQLGNPKQIIWQPIDWDILNSDGVHEIIRYVSCILLEGDISVTLVVAESMDGTLRAQISFRDPVECVTTSKMDIAADSTEQAIEKMKKKYSTLLEKAKETSGDNVTLSFEKEWGMECNHLSIIYQIKKLVSNKDGKVE